jgi:hypothetical protein
MSERSEGQTASDSFNVIQERSGGQNAPKSF